MAASPDIRAHRRRDLLQSTVVVAIAFTPAWLTPTWFAVPWAIAVGLSIGPLVWWTWTHAPWVPTPPDDLPRIVAMLDLRAGETFVDLGAGDGRLVLTIAEATGARAIGIEATPLLVAIGRLRAALSRAEVELRLADLYRADLSDADAVYVWGTAYGAGTARFRTFLARAMRPGARVVSYHTPIDGWTPDAVDTDGQRPLYRYVIPG